MVMTTACVGELRDGRAATRRRCRGRTALAVLLIASMARAASAQTLFPSPAGAPAFGRYDLEMCMGAVTRIRNSAQWNTRYDTLTAAELLLMADPPAVAQVARQCVGNRAVLQLPPGQRLTRLQVLLAAQADSVFRTELNSWATSMASSIARAKLLISVLQNAVLDRSAASAHPARLGLAEALTQQLDSIGSAALYYRTIAYNDLLLAADQVGDTATYRRVLARAMPTYRAYLAVDSVQQNAAGQLFFAVMQVWTPRWRELMDSLRARGPAHYLTVLSRMQGELASAAHMSASDSVAWVQGARRWVGQSAPALTADYWVGRTDSTATLPQRGKITLVAFVDDRCRGSCDPYPFYAMLRRLKRRYGGALEIVLVANTWGFFRLRPPLEPEAEANVLGWYFLNYLRIPAILAVDETPFVTRAAPDRRRFYQHSTVREAYSDTDPKHQNQWSPSGLNMTTLVAPDGHILYHELLGGNSPEQDLDRLIAAVVDYQRQHPGHLS